MKFLRRHPFATVAWFERVVAVSFSFPEATLRPLVPTALEIDSFEGLGFVTVSMVWSRHLRPAGFPKFLGLDFFLAGYRIFTRLRDPSGRILRGLRIVRSETDRLRMVWMGNLLTSYQYRKVSVSIAETGTSTRVHTSLPGGQPTLDLRFHVPSEEVEAELPAGSPFSDWKSARRFAGPMPYTFSPETGGKMIVIEGSRPAWTPRPVQVTDWKVGLFDEEPFRGVQPQLANAFIVRDVAYRWSRGRVITTSETA